MDQFVPSPSFIPKKTFSASAAVPPKKRRIGLLLLLSFVIFFASVLFYAGQFVYKLTLIRQQEGLKSSIDIAKSKFEEKTLYELTRMDGKISSVKAILGKHTNLIPLFGLLDANTLQSVRFRSFSFTHNGDRQAEISMTGDASSYTSIALQSDAFSKTGKLDDVVFSNLQVEEKTNRVSFKFSAKVDPSLLAVIPESAASPVPEAESEVPAPETATTTTP